MRETPHKSSIYNLDANLVALLVYILPLMLSMFVKELRIISWLAIPILVLMFEKKSQFVRAHAAQALTIAFIYLVFALVDYVIGFFGFTISIVMGAPLLGFMVGGVLGLFAMILALIIGLLSIILFVYILVIAVKAYNYETLRIPLLSVISDTILKMRR